MAIDRAQKAQEPDIEETLDDLSGRIERLRVLYEQYFMGIEKIEPHTARKEVSRKILELQQLNIRNTGLRYRFNTLVQKFSVYTTYWNRTLRAIENGTYIRDVARVGRHAAQRGQDIPEEVLRAMPERLRAKVIKERERLAQRQAKEEGMNAADELAAPERTEPSGVPPLPQRHHLDDSDAEIDNALDKMFGEADNAVASVVPAPVRASPPPPPAKRPTAPPPIPADAKPRMTTPPPIPSSARTPTPVLKTPTPAPVTAKVALPPGIDEAAARDLHKKYVQAKRLLGENVDHIKYENIVATLAKQAPAIMKQHQAKSVEFQVVIKDDKVILKATPKK
jgi:hypothetical protein